MGVIVGVIVGVIAGPTITPAACWRPVACPRPDGRARAGGLPPSRPPSRPRGRAGRSLPEASPRARRSALERESGPARGRPSQRPPSRAAVRPSSLTLLSRSTPDEINLKNKLVSRLFARAPFNVDMTDFCFNDHAGSTTLKDGRRCEYVFQVNFDGGGSHANLI